jgi:hypothetical protein
MPRGPAPSWTAAAPHTIEARPKVEAAVKIGYDVELTWAGIPTRDRAVQCKRGLHNAARLHKPQVSLSGQIEPDGNGAWRIRFKVHDKRKARAFIVAKHGTDRAAWPYNPRAGS